MNKHGLILKVLLIAAAWAIGWGLSWGLGFAPFVIFPAHSISEWASYVSVEVIASGVIGGWMTVLTLRWIEPSTNVLRRGSQILWVVIGWSLSRFVGLALGLFTDELGVIGWAITGAFGGGIMMSVLRRVNPPIRGAHALVTAGGWALGLDFGWYIAFVGGPAMMPLVFSRVMTDLVSVLLGGAIGGAIGTFVMFRQLNSAASNPAL